LQWQKGREVGYAGEKEESKYCVGEEWWREIDR